MSKQIDLRIEQLQAKKPCRKRKFDSRTEASKYVKYTNKRGEIHLNNAYKCPDCGFFHVTSAGKQRSREFTVCLRNRGQL